MFDSLDMKADIWFGNGILAKIVMAALICFFPAIVNTTIRLGGLNQRRQLCLSTPS
jgi:ABC-type nitrate/sulfonate/bicarbonate transport system permease component